MHYILIFLTPILFILFYILENAYKDTAKKSDLIVVLGARTGRRKGSNVCLQARVAHGIELFKKGFGKKIVFSGGKTKDDSFNESNLMKQLAVDSGISAKDILIDDSSLSTFQNLTHTKRIMKEQAFRYASNCYRSVPFSKSSACGEKVRLIFYRFSRNY